MMNVRRATWIHTRGTTRGDRTFVVMHRDSSEPLRTVLSVHHRRRRLGGLRRLAHVRRRCGNGGRHRQRSGHNDWMAKHAPESPIHTALQLDLASVADEMRGEAAYLENGHTARTLVREHDL